MARQWQWQEGQASLAWTLTAGAAWQVMGILGAMMFVRFGLEPLVKTLRTVFKASGSWEKSSEYHILREVRRTLHPKTLNPCLRLREVPRTLHPKTLNPCLRLEEVRLWLGLICPELAFTGSQ